MFVLKKAGPLNGGVLGNMQAKDLQNELAAADQLFNQKKFDDAIAAYRSILDKAPTLSVINLQIGNAFLNKNDYLSAIGAYNDLLKVDPTTPKGSSALPKRRSRAAIRTWRRLPSRKPPTIRRPHRARSSTTSAKSNSPEAMSIESVRWYKKASDADPSWGRPLYQARTLRAEDRRHGSGEAVFREGAERRPCVGGSGDGESHPGSTESVTGARWQGPFVTAPFSPVSRCARVSPRPADGATPAPRRPSTGPLSSSRSTRSARTTFLSTATRR